MQQFQYRIGLQLIIIFIVDYFNDHFYILII